MIVYFTWWYKMSNGKYPRSQGWAAINMCVNTAWHVHIARYSTIIHPSLLFPWAVWKRSLKEAIICITRTYERSDWRMAAPVAAKANLERVRYWYWAPGGERQHYASVPFSSVSLPVPGVPPSLLYPIFSSESPRASWQLLEEEDWERNGFSTTVQCHSA